MPIVISILSGALLTPCALKLIQMLQLSSYRNRGFFGWLKRSKYEFMTRLFALSFFSFVSMFVYEMCFGNGWYAYFGFIFFVVLAIYFSVVVFREKSKVPLKLTARVWRLLVTLFIINVGLCFIFVWLPFDTLIGFSLVGITHVFLPITLVLANLVNLPIEKAVASKYIRQAKRKLKDADPIVVGITGSYGKTTAKNLLKFMLAENYSVYSSPKSYNTPMGLCKCINEDYKGENVFIAEMGARYVGDIAILKKMLKPSYTMLTSIGNQHLETFGSRENIIKEKSLILDSEYAVGNSDCELVPRTCHLAGAEGEAVYTDVKSDINGTHFKLSIGGQTVNIDTKLIGDHIPSMVACCALMAVKLGVPLARIGARSKDLPFVEHRLEVLNSGEIIVIDDSFNSNPKGAESALNILATSKNRKVVITPGFVELGTEQDVCNRLYGEQIGKICDYAILLGPNTEIIKSGINNECNVIEVESLDAAMKCLREIQTPLAVLFENDLPDNY